MKLSIREIHKSQAIYNLLVELDEQIIKLDKRAMSLMDKSSPVDLTFTFGNEKNKKVLDEGGSLNTGADRLSSMFSSLYMPYGAMPEPKKDTLEMKLSDVEAISVIGFLINIKKQQRAGLIGEFHKMGFEL